MTSTSSKAIPFIVLAIVGGFMAVDMFTLYKITEPMINLATIVLTPMGIGGLVNKAWNVYREIKTS
mgnify:CR=1 FL=1